MCEPDQENPPRPYIPAARALPSDTGKGGLWKGLLSLLSLGGGLIRIKQVTEV